MLSNLTAPFIKMLESLSQVVPIPLFTGLGAFIEEVIAPIPSPLVMTLSGSLAKTTNEGLGFLFLLAIIGSTTKTIGSYLVYVVADKAEDLIMNKLGRFLGISHKELESLGQNLSGGKKDDIILFLMRAIPIVPTAPVSVMCGLLKINMKTYLTTTALGTLIRNIFYLYLGYTGVGALESINSSLDSFESIGYLIILFVLTLLVIYIYQQRRSENSLQKLLRKLRLR